LNEEFETQSMATNASRFFSRKLNARNADLEGDNERTRNIKTNLVHENSKTEEKIFRQTFWSNFTKNGGLSIRSEDADETKNFSPEHEN
jgi:hypothetical protein